MIEPETPEEWQEAVDAAKAMLEIDDARKYGLVRGGPPVDVARIEEILERGKQLGYTPAPDAIQRLLG